MEQNFIFNLNFYYYLLTKERKQLIAATIDLSWPIFKSLNSTITKERDTFLESISPTHYERICANILAPIKSLTFIASTKKLRAKLLHEKAARKMLVKLSPALEPQNLRSLLIFRWTDDAFDTLPFSSETTHKSILHFILKTENILMRRVYTSSYSIAPILYCLFSFQWKNHWKYFLRHQFYLQMSSIDSFLQNSAAVCVCVMEREVDLVYGYPLLLLPVVVAGDGKPEVVTSCLHHPSLPSPGRGG